MYITRLRKREGRERDSRTHARRPPEDPREAPSRGPTRGALPLKVKYIKKTTTKNPDKNVNLEVNSNDMDSHGIKTMYTSYPRQKLMSIMINTYQKEISQMW